ncbi:hypothetical protein RGQ29_028490 [Quercus rubra]|uniref:Major facilitator superfamily (MFS) profile domain-containing protein n=1 Tax=Quercus rubra TaxID=3512 RepID=A0AAN7IMQ2_QUERU|nr:hypothetical protein RGQ29_028490 [Quercus rubra]
MGGLIFGYDIGISGGVTSMAPFLQKFFPSVYHKEALDKSTNQYCKFDSVTLTMFTSSLYLAALVASFGASLVTNKLGRKFSTLPGGLVFLAGAIINAAALNIAMLIIGRILLGIGVGFANQPLASKHNPNPNSWVALRLHEFILFFFFFSFYGNMGSLNIIFQLCITIGISIAYVLNYVTTKIKGGYGWRVSLGGAAVPTLFIRIRGVSDKEIEAEFKDFVSAIGFGDNASLLSSLITGGINCFATLVSIYGTDRWGQVIDLPKWFAGLVVFFICAYVAAFACEIFPLEIRSAAQSITVSVNMLFTFIVAQLFLTMLCHLKFGLFIFFAFFVVLMTLFVYFFLPETKNIPIEEMTLVWKEHWFWRRFMPEDRPQYYAGIPYYKYLF